MASSNTDHVLHGKDTLRHKLQKTQAELAQERFERKHWEKEAWLLKTRIENADEQLEFWRHRCGCKEDEVKMWEKWAKPWMLQGWTQPWSNTDKWTRWAKSPSWWQYKDTWWDKGGTLDRLDRMALGNTDKGGNVHTTNAGNGAETKALCFGKALCKYKKKSPDPKKLPGSSLDTIMEEQRGKFDGDAYKIPGDLTS